MHDKLIQSIVKEIEERHREIIEDWGKAYLAQLYEEGVDIKPGCFILYEQVPTFHKGQDCMVKKYWFEPGTPRFDDDNI